MYKQEDYEKFAAAMEEKFPSMFDGPYGGFVVGPGWWPIVETLCGVINSHVEWNNAQRALLTTSNPYKTSVPPEIAPVRVIQVKEKFGGLRFYYDGGDDYVDGLVRMAECWASTVCEECGAPGARRSGGWVKTLCDHHEAERQKRYKELDRAEHTGPSAS